MSKYKILALILLLIWYGAFLFHPLDLTTSDLGRHLKNGELILSGDFKVLTTNFYSFTNSDYSVLNHHWGTGVIFYLISKIAGFTGLHLFFIALSLLTFFMFFYLAVRESNFAIAGLASFLIVPLIAERTEIRPEVFSYFFLGLFLFILWHYSKNLISWKWLFILPILEIFWVNAHIYFIFGLFLISVFLLEKRTIKLFLILILSSLATLLNPAGLKGALAPLNIFQNYGYRIVENQSVYFLDKLGFIDNPNLLLVKIVLGLVTLSFILILIKNKKQFSPIYFILALVFGAMAFLAIRNFTIFGLFSLLIVSCNLRMFAEKIGGTEIIIALIPIFILTIFNVQLRGFGLGLTENINASAEFFQKEKIKGPIFNNYDIGGYLIYHLFPEEKVFVDNRPEAYPASFFEQIYVPVQESEDIWKQQNETYGFNVIFFSHRDATPWGQKFLVARANDPDWKPVFADQYAIIFLRKEAND